MRGSDEPTVSVSAVTVSETFVYSRLRNGFFFQGGWITVDKCVTMISSYSTTPHNFVVVMNFSFW